MQKNSTLRFVRSALKLTQVEMAEVLGITRKEYAKLEHTFINSDYKDLLSPEIKQALVTVLDVNMQFVYGAELEMFHNSHTSYGRELDRILAVIEHKKVSVGVFAEGLDIDESDRMKFIADVSAGRDPGSGYAAAILACYPDVNRTFLRKGHGPIVKG